jgi:hypothetical protein
VVVVVVVVAVAVVVDVEEEDRRSEGGAAPRGALRPSRDEGERCIARFVGDDVRLFISYSTRRGLVLT